MEVEDPEGPGSPPGRKKRKKVPREEEQENTKERTWTPHVTSCLNRELERKAEMELGVEKMKSPWNGRLRFSGSDSTPFRDMQHQVALCDHRLQCPSWHYEGDQLRVRCKLQGIHR